MLVVDKSYVRNSRIFLALDAFLEFMALLLICGLRYDIYTSETALLASEEGDQDQSQNDDLSLFS